eukprot:6729980-Lingulodinium_polyedra.AAC.1
MPGILQHSWIHPTYTCKMTTFSAMIRGLCTRLQKQSVLQGWNYQPKINWVVTGDASRKWQVSMTSL